MGCFLLLKIQCAGNRFDGRGMAVYGLIALFSMMPAASFYVPAEAPYCVLSSLGLFIVSGPDMYCFAAILFKESIQNRVECFSMEL